MSLTVMETVTKILAAFRGSESRGEGIHKTVVIDLKTLALQDNLPHPSAGYTALLASSSKPA